MPIMPATHDHALPTGPAAAALLGTGAGSLFLALLAIAADRIPGLQHAMIFYRPTGPLSGVTTTSIVLWLVLWAVLHFRWRARSPHLRPICIAAFCLFVIGLLLTFPPLADSL
jgi:hypothetical protein